VTYAARMDATERRRILGTKLPPHLGDDMERLHTLVEVAFLAAAADGELAEEEIELLASNLQTWLGEKLEPSFLVNLFDHLVEQLAAEGLAARLEAAADALDDDDRRVAYTLACITTLCDLEVHDDELGFLGTIADAFGIPQPEAQATFDELDDVVSSLAAQA
jgi:hypothetical protein